MPYSPIFLLYLRDYDGKGRTLPSIYNTWLQIILLSITNNINTDEIVDLKLLYCKHFPSASITVIEMKILIPYCTSKISKFRMVDGQQFKVRRDLSSIVFYFFLSPRCEDFHFVIPTLYFFLLHDILLFGYMVSNENINYIWIN